MRQLGENATEADWQVHLEDVRAATTQALAGLRKLNEEAVLRHRARLKSLEEKREKFLEAFYADALPADLLKSEQNKIAVEMDEAKSQLAEAEADVTGVADAFNQTLDAVGRMVDTYREARDIDRRLWNQALFECFRVYPDEGIEGELREEVDLLTARTTPRRLRRECRAGVSSGRGWNKSYSAGLMRRYSNPEVKARLSRLDLG